MSRYVRNYVPGGTFFFTVVTYARRPMLTTELARTCLREAIESVRASRPFQALAIVLLPDHLHTVWVMPEDDADFSIRWKRIKECFTKAYLARAGTEAGLPSSRRARGERGLWQRRFWEHTCRNEQDLKRCVDYIHWNPVKHGLVERVRDHPWSSFHRFVEMEEYPSDWGGENPCPGLDVPE